jgi:hypothetical protein
VKKGLDERAGAFRFFRAILSLKCSCHTSAVRRRSRLCLASAGAGDTTRLLRNCCRGFNAALIVSQLSVSLPSVSYLRPSPSISIHAVGSEYFCCWRAVVCPLSLQSPRFFCCLPYSSTLCTHSHTHTPSSLSLLTGKGGHFSAGEYSLRHPSVSTLYPSIHPPPEGKRDGEKGDSFKGTSEAVMQAKGKNEGKVKTCSWLLFGGCIIYLYIVMRLRDSARP